ncbi:SCO family protein [Puniceicoccus vermicola]|uniref:SCO family protein n=1 Tax=Puniceicoccus vermicola TaxID=388746 RepID=A0A7X1B3V7_9BACT|nr:SCO family protein [Puniceicoccus vermicola]MBC2604033.1 SCO family protein [Puniceicoccus vermicola]
MSWTGLTLPILLLFLTSASGREIRGTITESEPAKQQVSLTLESGKTLGPLEVGSGDAAIGYENQEIVGDLTESGKTMRLTHIWPDNQILANAMAGVNRSLIRNAATLGRNDSLVRGDYLPDFALYNQRGEPVYSSHLRKSPTVLTFLFTRCGDPNMCPATAARLSELGDRAAKAGWDQARFVAVSFDPEYDTPGVLHQYGEVMGMNTPSFELLTGDPEAIEALLRLVGVRTFDEDGTIVHNLVTLLTDSHGRIVLRQDGSRWSADAIYERLEEMNE